MADRHATTRRDCLRLLSSGAAGAAIALCGPGALAQAVRQAGQAERFQVETQQGAPRPRDETYDFHIARLQFECQASGRGAKWNVYPGADRYLLEELSRVVRCRVRINTNCSGMSPDHGGPETFNAVVTLNDPETLREHPFVLMTGEGAFAFGQGQRANLKRYVEEGGFLLIDDCVFAPAGDHLYQSARKMLEETFGAGSVRKISNDHEVFHNVFDLGSIGLPWLQGKNHGAQGVFLGERLAIFLSSTDLHCGWVDRAGAWFPNPALGKHGYKEAIQMGVNIVMYAMAH